MILYYYSIQCVAFYYFCCQLNAFEKLSIDLIIIWSIFFFSGFLSLSSLKRWIRTLCMKYINFLFNIVTIVIAKANKPNHLNNLTVMDAEFVVFFVTYWTQDMAASLPQFVPLFSLLLNLLYNGEGKRFICLRITKWNILIAIFTLLSDTSFARFKYFKCETKI